MEGFGIETVGWCRGVGLIVRRRRQKRRRRRRRPPLEQRKGTACFLDENRRKDSAVNNHVVALGVVPLSLVASLALKRALRVGRTSSSGEAAIETTVALTRLMATCTKKTRKE